VSARASIQGWILTIGAFWRHATGAGILRDWVQRALDAPDETEEHDDDTRHYIKRIPEFGDRWLCVIINVAKQPNKRRNRLLRSPAEEET